jgi:hypothetical protein
MRGYTLIQHGERAPNGFIKKDGARTDLYVWYKVELWEQPFWPWLIATIYHWYHMWIYRVPGFKTAEWVRGKPHWRSGPLEYLPLVAEQDCKCHYLDNKKRKVLAEVRVGSDSEIVKACWPKPGRT